LRLFPAEPLELETWHLFSFSLTLSPPSLWLDAIVVDAKVWWSIYKTNIGPGVDDLILGRNV
jgi:hypothetical protein